MHINQCRLFNAKFFLYKYIKCLICKHIFIWHFQTSLIAIFFYTVKRFQLFRSNTNKSFYNQSFVKYFQVLIFNIHNSIKNQSFVYTKLNGMFTLSLNVKQFKFTDRYDRVR